MADKEAIKKRVLNEEDYIYHPRSNNSLRCFLSKHPDGVPDSQIAKLLTISEEEVGEIYETVIKRLRKALEHED